LLNRTLHDLLFLSLTVLAVSLPSRYVYSISLYKLRHILKFEKIVIKIQGNPSTPPASFVKGCVIFGVPHRGADFPMGLKLILSLVSPTGLIEAGKIIELGPKSALLANISDEFRQARKTLGIDILSCWEMQIMKKAGQQVSLRETHKAGLGH